MNIRDFLKNYINKKIIYIPNPGNAGDSLIALGTIQVFKKMGLNFSIGHRKKKYKNEILFYAGGGNLVGLYGSCRQFIKDNQHHNKIVLLPHTVYNEDQLIQNLSDNVTIICREKVSYDYVSRLIKNKNNVLLSEDMAFNIRKIKKYKLVEGRGVINCFRQDVEKTDIKIPKGNIDLSAKLVLPKNTSNISQIKRVSHSIFNKLSKYNTVNTNRLHIAVAGSLLNKNVNLYSNSYYKNKSVYDHSIRDKFKNTKFIEKTI